MDDGGHGQLSGHAIETSELPGFQTAIQTAGARNGADQRDDGPLLPPTLDSTGARREAPARTIVEVADEADDEDDEDDEDDRPTVGRQAWIQPDDYWRKATYIAATGRHAVPRPPTRALPRPQRFQRPSRQRSLVIAALVVGIVVVVLAGTLIAQREAAKRLVLPTSLPYIPGLTQPTAAPKVTPKVTPSPSSTTTPSSK